MTKTLTTTLKKLTLFASFNIAVVIVVLLLCEGAASLGLMAQRLTFTPPVAERAHTQYDSELGWVNRPNVTIPDMYGPGLALMINGQGFRNVQDFDNPVPQNQQRIICSGDSFTLGYGVDNFNNWCALLSAINPGWQTVNMGQGGYGLGQAYLWYKRDGVQLEHNLHLFAFITRDFERMQADQFLGYGKPLLSMQNGQLAVENVPVPRRAFYVPWLTQNSDTLRQLKLMQLFSQITAPPVEKLPPQPDDIMPDPQPVVAKIFENLHQINRDKHSTLILVYLPTWGDYDPAAAPDTEAWRQFVRQTAAEQEIVFIDLIEPFREIPDDQIYTLFLHEGENTFPGAAGHYSVRGNQFVAQQIYNRLTIMPETSQNVASQ